MNTASVSPLLPGQQIGLAAKTQVLEYKNERIVSRLIARAELTHEAAEQLFRDMLMFLSLTDNGIKLAPSAKIDLAWHEFILHTRDYANFCETYFGHFVHHEPESWVVTSKAKLDVAETARFAESVFGELSTNWALGKFSPMTCGSGGC